MKKPFMVLLFLGLLASPLLFGITDTGQGIQAQYQTTTAIDMNQFFQATVAADVAPQFSAAVRFLKRLEVSHRPRDGLSTGLLAKLRLVWNTRETKAGAGALAMRATA